MAVSGFQVLEKIEFPSLKVWFIIQIENNHLYRVFLLGKNMDDSFN